MDPGDQLTRMNPHLLPIVDEAALVHKAIAHFKKERRCSPLYIIINPHDWRAGIIDGYCGLMVLRDEKVFGFELTV